MDLGASKLLFSLDFGIRLPELSLGRKTQPRILSIGGTAPDTHYSRDKYFIAYQNSIHYLDMKIISAFLLATVALSNAQLLRPGISVDLQDYDALRSGKITGDVGSVIDVTPQVRAGERSIAVETPNDALDITWWVMQGNEDGAAKNGAAILEAARASIESRKAFVSSFAGQQSAGVGDESFGGGDTVTFRRDNILCRISARSFKATPIRHVPATIDVRDLAERIDATILAMDTVTVEELQRMSPVIKEVRFSKEPVHVGHGTTLEQHMTDIIMTAEDPLGGNVSVKAIVSRGGTVTYKEGRVTLRIDGYVKGTLPMQIHAINEALLVSVRKAEVEVINHGSREKLPELSRAEMHALVEEAKERGLSNEEARALLMERARQKKAGHAIPQREPTQRYQGNGLSTLSRKEREEIAREGIKRGDTVEEINKTLQDRAKEKQGIDK